MNESVHHNETAEHGDDERNRQLLSRHRRHREILVISLAVVCLSFFLRVRPDQRVEFIFAPGWASPETCLSRGLWGMECAGCGLTRSFVYLAGGDFAASVAIHRVGWMLALATVIQIPYRSYMMRCLKTRGLREPIPRQVNWLMSWTLIVALIGNWLLKLCGI